jgi:alpha-mannosidase
LNNYWHTNYKAQQDGTITFRYRLMSDVTITEDRAFRAGKLMRRPQYAHRMSYQDFRSPKPPYLDTEGTLAHVRPETVALSTLRPAGDGRGWIARIQEIAGRDDMAEIRIDWVPIVSACRTDLLGRDVERLGVSADGTVRVPVSPWDLVSVRFETEGSGK